jgi:hypothetical protein
MNENQNVDTKLNLNLNLKLNLRDIVLFYLSKFYESGGSMTLDQLQADINAVNGLLSTIQRVFPSTGTANSVITFLEQADEDPLLQNIMLLVINMVAQPSPAPAPVPPAAIK